MNLYAFLNYRHNCPICGTPLTTYLHSQKKQSIKYEEDRVVVIFPLNTLKGKGEGKDYKVGYSFGLHDTSFQIEFYDKELKRMDNESPFFLIKRFKELNKNLKFYAFYRQCNSCYRYHYSSNNFSITFSILSEQHFQISSEYFGLVQNCGGGGDYRFRIYRLFNIFDRPKDTSILYYWIGSNVNEAMANRHLPYSTSQLELPLIPFVSEEETINRLKKIITFS